MNPSINISSLDEKSKKLLQEVNELAQLPESLRIFLAVTLSMFAILGFIGNFLTIAALLKCPKVRDVTGAFISSLCLACMGLSVLVLPFDVIKFVDENWTKSRTMCLSVPFFRYTNVSVASISIAAIAINRYIMIVHHRAYAVIYKKHWIAFMIGLSWVFSYALGLLPLFGIWGKFDHNPRFNSCSLVKDSAGRSPQKFLFIFGFIVPTVFIVTCYSRIFWVVHRSKKKMRQHNTKEPWNLTEDAKQTPTEWRLLKMSLAIFLSFVLCHLPLTFSMLSNYTNLGFYLAGFFVFYLSVWVNPIIYGVMNVQYRKAYASVIFFWKQRTDMITPQE